ncbi:nucleoside triphosphate pyrophosphohydrolase [Halocella sp. SP3-1]|uniref:nucleoside triphosphate pyrophosphohydrolase n=1 Tax=Halocella sp. SP3-1 TaxID=2382161 RepID=UPI000F761830|nr:nucleoside triphosphate pyrophosphohydrolase [Halocella sp. SP3-1]AZO93183.1 nucleoside triphosphate pyrophosphohydrolase [Halocella sp. SP3-1]
MDKEKMAEELNRLVDIMEVLRGPDGCPWDKKQNYNSLEPYIIEEAYEVVEALQREDITALKEELGDLLLQVVFQAQIGKERDDFTLIDVLEGINNKLIRRHPHVFQEKKLSSANEVKHLWEEIKKEEKIESGKRKESILDDVSQAQTALNQADELQKKAAEVGFDWSDIKDVVCKIEEELGEVTAAIEENDKTAISEEIGDLLFAVVNLARFSHVNSELALLKTILKFKDRFRYIEERVKDKGAVLEKLALDELDEYWEEAKHKLSYNKEDY